MYVSGSDRGQKVAGGREDCERAMYRLTVRGNAGFMPGGDIAKL